MDLFNDKWIPTDKGDLSPIDALKYANRIQWPRSDWNAATILVLHAMVQTAVVLNKKCRNRVEWSDFLGSVPDDLDAWLHGIDPGPNPWQCMTAKKRSPVSKLLPESPGENAEKKCSDISVWQESAIKSLTPNEAFIGLIATQFWGLPGGQGHKGGCRGQNPLTIMVEPNTMDATLWDRVWLNILPQDKWENATKLESRTIAFEFPWKKNRIKSPSTPANTNALEMLWQMPRRWRIIQDKDGLVREMVLEGKGIVYEGWINHPLTSYNNKSKNKKSKKVQNDSDTATTVKTKTTIGFTDWSSLMIAINNSEIKIPIVVSEYVEDDEKQFVGQQYRLRCFGWSSGDFGPAAWSESVVPLCVKSRHKDIETAITAAKVAHANLSRCLGIIKPSLKIESARLFQAVEAEFYACVKTNDWTGWERYLKRQVRSIFWEVMDIYAYGYDKVFTKVTPNDKKIFLGVM